MSSWRIRELEDEINKLEREQRNYDRYSDKWRELEKRLDELKSELCRLKRKREEDERITHSSSIFGVGGFGFGSHSGGFGSFGGGGFGGGGAGGHW